MNRREVMAAVAALAAASATNARAAAGARVVIVGGGFGGASVARTLRRVAPEVHVTLVEREAQFVSCPRSNVVIAGLAQMDEITFGDAGLRKAGIAVVRDAAVEIDSPGRTVRLKSGRRLAYDRLVLSPGVDFVWNALEGYDAAAAEIMPHAWKAGPQTLLLRDKLRAMPDGGLVLIAAPADPYRCPPGPYERACLIADYLKREKPRSKILILDAKDTFSKQPLFQEAWTTLYPGMIEWIPAAKSGRVRAVKAGEGVVSTDFDDHKPAVANIIPPQRAGAIAFDAGLAEPTGFCKVDPVTFESAKAKGVHLVGDAIMPGDMPKSGFAANVQGKACAHALAALLRGAPPPEPMLINTCYSLASETWGFSIAGVYKPLDGALRLVKGSGGISPVGADVGVRGLEAQYERSWFDTLTSELWG